MFDTSFLLKMTTTVHDVVLAVVVVVVVEVMIGPSYPCGRSKKTRTVNNLVAVVAAVEATIDYPSIPVEDAKRRIHSRRRGR